MRVGRILDKTRWTKGLGNAATVVYGDCNEDIELSKHSSAGGHETTRRYLSLRLIATHARNAREGGLRRGNVMKHGAPMRRLWRRAPGRHASWVVERSSRRI